MQPVGVILKAVEVVKGGHPRWLVPPQACTIGVKVPLQRHGPYGQARAVGGAVPIAHGVEQSVLIVEQPIDRMGGAVGLRTIIGRSAGDPTATPLQHHRGPRPAEVQRRPLGHAPQALRKLPFGRGLIDLPGPVEDLVAQLACTVRLHLQDRVEQAQHQRDLGEEPPPRLTCRFPAVGADRARLVVWRASLSFLGTLALAPLHGHRIGGLDHAHAQETAAANSRRDVDLLLRDLGQLPIGHQIARQRLWLFDRGADKRRAAEGQPGTIPAHGIAATDVGQGVKRPPHWRRERAFSTSSVRAIMEGMTHEGRRVKTAPVVINLIRRMIRSCLTDA